VRHQLLNAESVLQTAERFIARSVMGGVCGTPLAYKCGSKLEAAPHFVFMLGLFGGL
jgi:hypothetical protein